MGKFKVELDSRVLKDITSLLEGNRPSKEYEPFYMHEIWDYCSGKIGELAGLIVPLEIVTPPLTIEQFSHLETLREELHKHQAEGTKASLTNAFGMHINPDITSSDMNDIKEVLRAFLILYPWLKSVMKVDLSRRILPFIDPFPNDYIKLIMPTHYAPTYDKFVNDYLIYSPTRNRALDLLPLFAYSNPELLDGLSKTIRNQIKPRPALHYRLPNYEVDNSSWTIARDWNYWVEVEILAADQERLDLMAKDYLSALDNKTPLFEQIWLAKLSTSYGYTS